MKKQNVLLAAAFVAAITVSFSGCGVKFKPFVQKDTGPKVYLMTGVNQMENGDFSMGEKHWGTFFSQGGDAEFKPGDGGAKIKIKNPGSVEYAVQIYYDGMRLYHDGDYTLSFTASSDKVKACEVRLQLNGGDYHAYAIDTIPIGEEKRYELHFVMNEDSDVAPRLAFNLGKNKDLADEGDGKCTVVLKDVSLVLNNTIAEDEKGNGGADFVRVNQIGFGVDDEKYAYAKVEQNGLKFQVLDEGKNVVYSGKLDKPVRDELANEYSARADFSKLKTPGKYTVRVGENESFVFEIKDKVYDGMLYDTLKFFTLARCGVDVEDDVWGHPACHTGEAVTTNRKTHKTILGGWHDAGDYGRYVVPAAKSVADLLLVKDAAASVGFDVLEEVKVELDWMLQMQSDNGGVWHKLTCTKFNAFEMPEYETAGLFLSPVSYCATADFAAALAFASVYYRESDAAYADTLLSAAKKAWDWMEANPFKEFKNESYISTGEYGDKSGDDEKYFAACALALATGDSSYGAVAEEVRNGKDAAEWHEQFGWERMEGYGDRIILENQNLFPKSLVSKVKKAVLKACDSYVSQAKLSGFGQAQKDVGWGSNMEAMNISHLLYLGAKIGGKADCIRVAKAQVDYVLGSNPLSRCYVTGYGSNPPLHPHHRPSIALDTPQKGMLVGGPDSALEDEFAVNLLSDKPALQCYVDNYQSFSTNEMTIYWNSALVAALGMLYY